MSSALQNICCYFQTKITPLNYLCGHLSSLQSQFYCKDFKNDMKVFFINLSWGVGVRCFLQKGKKKIKEYIHYMFCKLPAHKLQIIFFKLKASVRKFA